MLVLLDTDICIHLISRRSGYERVLRRVSGRSIGEICISAITVSELRFGVAKSARSSANALALDEFLSRFELLDYPVEASASYGKIRADLERAGTPIGNNDLLIAAHALAEDSALVTNNAREFLRVPGLAVQEWALD